MYYTALYTFTHPVCLNKAWSATLIMETQHLLLLPLHESLDKRLLKTNWFDCIYS